MTRGLFRLFAAALALLLTAGMLALPVRGADMDEAAAAMEQSAKPLAEQDDAGWKILALRSAGMDSVRDAAEQLAAEVKQSGGDFGRLTDLERAIINLSAAGYDAQNIGGVDLIERLAERNLTVQGFNGLVMALIALDCADYPDTAALNRESLVEEILGRQRKDGCFPLQKGEIDSLGPDLTAFAVIALSRYRETEGVNEALDAAVSWLAEQQSESGGFGTPGIDDSSESVSMVIAALVSADFSPEDGRFIREEKDLVELLLQYQLPGGFAHHLFGNANNMATEQAILALSAVRSGGSPFYIANLPELAEPEPISPAVVIALVVLLFLLIYGILLFVGKVGKIVSARKPEQSEPEQSEL